ncbi:hypothetical protein PM082_009583 [Marasmius tenuissimus]|nr:hypothetical protein PM082_009583 [Marasmius tenuissimus]
MNRRANIYLLLPLVCLWLQARAGALIEPSATLLLHTAVPELNTASQSYQFSKPFNLEHSRLRSNSRITLTRALTTQFMGIPGADSVVVGDMASMIPASGLEEPAAIVTSVYLQDRDINLPFTTNSFVTELINRVSSLLHSALAGSHETSSASSSAGSLVSSTAGNSAIQSSKPAPAGPASPSPTEKQGRQPAQDKDPKPIIIGSVIGGVIFLASVVILFLLLRRQCRRRGRTDHPEGFCRDMMVLNTVETNISNQSPKREILLAGDEEGKHLELDPTSSTTPLQEDFEGYQFDDRRSLSTSVSSRSSGGKRSLSVSGISSMSAVSSAEAPHIPIPPLTPVSLNSPPSSAHLRVASRARTDRQMQIEEKVIELQRRFITTDGTDKERDGTREELQERIERVKGLRESEWAYGGEGEVPEALVD